MHCWSVRWGARCLDTASLLHGVLTTGFLTTGFLTTGFLINGSGVGMIHVGASSHRHNHRPKPSSNTVSKTRYPSSCPAPIPDRAPSRRLFHNHIRASARPPLSAPLQDRHTITRSRHTPSFEVCSASCRSRVSSLKISPTWNG